MTYVNNDGASYNIEEALNVVNKMDMGGMSGSSASSKPSCKISVCIQEVSIFQTE